ncbi:uncharacterized protein LOC108815213 [Raphanus sativus]|uniref:Uncharacterized protein LOC108815213 n=1 Tax=Raphanus sativus TaxID=3726 RepID=A0A6J0K5Y5_RAPSA|nr:uncharacterized protein LOC108815213 [Raphanus sativus]
MGEGQEDTFSSPTGIESGTLAASIVWSLWISRNQLLFEKRKFTPEETILKAITNAREWMQVQTPPSPKVLKPLIRSEPNPSQADVHSIYTDATWNSSTRCAGLGWIVDYRDSSSQHAATSTFVSSPLMAETMAVLAAMTFARDHGIDTLSISSDFQTLINMLNRQERTLELYGVMSDIYFLCRSFILIKFIFIPRAANARADSVTKHALWTVNLD